MPMVSRGTMLLAYAEPAENLTQQLVGGVLPGDCPQGLLSQPQLLGEQFQLGLAAYRAPHVPGRNLQRLDVPRPGNVDVLAAAAPAGKAQQGTTQALYSRAVESREPDPRPARSGLYRRRLTHKVDLVEYAHAGSASWQLGEYLLVRCSFTDGRIDYQEGNVCPLDHRPGACDAQAL